MKLEGEHKSQEIQLPSPTVNVVSCNAKVWEDLHRLPHIEGVPLNSACYLVQGRVNTMIMKYCMPEKTMWGRNCHTPSSPA